MYIYIYIYISSAPFTPLHGTSSPFPSCCGVTAGHDDRKGLAGVARVASVTVGHAVSHGVSAAGLTTVSELRDGPGGAPSDWDLMTQGLTGCDRWTGLNVILVICSSVILTTLNVLRSRLR